jgi:hypothetical protein
MLYNDEVTRDIHVTQQYVHQHDGQKAAAMKRHVHEHQKQQEHLITCSCPPSSYLLLFSMFTAEEEEELRRAG